MDHMTRKQDFTRITLTLRKNRNVFSKPFSVFQISTRVTIDNFIETRGDLVFLKWKIVPLGSKRVSRFFYKVDETVKLTRLFLCSRCLFFLFLILEHYMHWSNPVK